jgi:ribonuclease J
MMSGMRIAVLGGNREIGGNKILVATRDGGLFLDFGKSYGVEDRYFEVPWNPPFHIPSLLGVGALPDIPGLYRHEPGARGFAVAVSHPHQDHVGYVSHLAPGTRVITGVDTKNLLDIRTESGQSSWETDVSHLDWRLGRTGDVIELADLDIRIRPVHVDHSVPASYGFIAEAGGLRVAYTGDLRMHGAVPELTDDFIAALRESRVDVLFCEGTRVRPPGGDPDEQFLAEMGSVFRARMGEEAPQPSRVRCGTEKEVRDALETAKKGSPGLVVIEVSPLDIDRMRSIWQAAVSARRRVVLTSRQAYLLQQATLRTRIGQLPPLYGSVLLLSQRRKAKNDLAPGDAEDAETFTKGRSKWEQQLCDDWQANGGDVYWGQEGRAELRGSPERYVVCTPQAVGVLSELAYRAAPCPLSFILSKSEAFTEEMILSFDRLLHWLHFFGCDGYQVIHVSGHASADDLRSLVEAASPNAVVPVHTRFPELMVPWHDRVIVPATDGSVELS